MNRLFEKIKGGTLATTIWFRMRKKNALSQNSVFRKQEILLDDILKYAVLKVPYYRDLLGGNKELTIDRFPVVSKKEITARFDSFMSIDKNRFEITDAYTGGSTGEPFHILLSGGYEYDFGRRKWLEMGYHNGDVILAMDGTKIDENHLKKNIYWLKKNKDDIPFGSWALSSLYLNDENAESYCRYINELKPSFIRGYPSFIYAISCYAEKLHISFTDEPFVKAIEVTSESAMPYQLEKIEGVFGAPVYQQYGHTESCVFAYTFDATRRYKVEPLYGYVEVLDEKDDPVKENEVGEVVVTSLHNYTMPLIRYRTGDLAVYGGKDDRYLYLNQVMGRTQDYIVSEQNNKVLLTALIFGQHCKAMGKIRKWQLEQFEPGKLIVHIIKYETWTQEDEKEIFTQFLKLGHVKSEFDYVTEIALTPRGKSKMLVQHIQM